MYEIHSFKKKKILLNFAMGKDAMTLESTIAEIDEMILELVDGVIVDYCCEHFVLESKPVISLLENYVSGNVASKAVYDKFMAEMVSALNEIKTYEQTENKKTAGLSNAVVYSTAGITGMAIIAPEVAVPTGVIYGLFLVYNASRNVDLAQISANCDHLEKDLFGCGESVWCDRIDYLKPEIADSLEKLAN